VLKATLENEKEAGLFVHGCDKEFITAARTALPELLDEIERLQAVIARLENQLCSIKPGTYTASTR
jgi:hypothetical protein